MDIGIWQVEVKGQKICREHATSGNSDDEVKSARDYIQLFENDVV
jgi:hypothetical protein